MFQFRKVSRCVLAGLIFFTSLFSLKAQIIPANEAVIHYTFVHFQEELSTNSEKYRIEIRPDNFITNDTVNTISAVSPIPSFYLGNLKWDKKYFWRVKAYNKLNECVRTSDVHQFEIRTISTLDFEAVKVKVNTAKKDKFENDLVSIDNTRSIFDREGNKIWSMPMIPGVVDYSCQVRDMKLTGDNTLTFLTDKNIFEIDFSGNVLWSGPQPCLLGKDTVKFHHAFTKDNKGNYWAIGNYKTYRKILVGINEKILPFVEGILKTDSGIYRKIEMDVLLKFNKDHKIVWYWDANRYMKDEDINFRKNNDSVPEFSIHSNAFSVNKSGTTAYLGMRDMSRVVKIDIKTKKVINSWGEKLPSGDARQAVNMFRSQHDAGVTEHNTILILNNNTRGRGPSAVMELKDNIKPGEDPVKWRFSLDFDSPTKGISIKGGNVIEQKNRNLFVCAGTLNRVFEVTRNKEVVWDAFILSRTKSDTSWHPMPQYRCNLVKKIVFGGVIVKTESVKRQQNKVNVICRIINSGNVADSYKLQVKDANGKVMYSFQSPVISPGENYKANVSFSSENRELLLKVVSTSNKFVASRQPFSFR